MRIDWSEPALADLDAIYDFIARDSSHYATRFVGRILDATERLAALPLMGRVLGDLDVLREKVQIRRLLGKSPCSRPAATAGAPRLRLVLLPQKSTLNPNLTRRPR